jgi:Putative zinc-finger
MKRLACAAARRRLQAFHDGELPVGDQIAVAGHVDRCRDCANALAELQFVASALRGAATVRGGLTIEEAASFQSAVVSRAKAERDASLVARVRDMFDDMHLVYAGLGATAATLACLVIMLTMMRFASSERSDSLAAMVAFLATPGSSADAIAIDAASHARWTARFQAATESAQQDAVFTLSNVVTREGRLADLERLRTRGHKAASEEAKLIEHLMDSVSRGRLEGVLGDGLSSATGIVGLITHTTVRATAATATRTIDLVLPAAKKRAANSFSVRLRSVVA